MSGPILPGATIGVLGSGQLGRMLALAARRMGYRICTFSPERDTPTGQVADREITAAYDDLDAIRAFAAGVDVVTLEFENIPTATVEAIGAFVPVRPGGAVLHTTQHRIREKTFLRDTGFPVTPFRAVDTVTDLREGLAEFGYPAVLKTADFGYDGKGQVKIGAPDEANACIRSASAGDVRSWRHSCISSARSPSSRHAAWMARSRTTAPWRTATPTISSI